MYLDTFYRERPMSSVLNDESCAGLSAHLMTRLTSATPTLAATHLGVILGAAYPFLRPLIAQVRSEEIDSTALMPSWTLRQFMMQMLVSTYTFQSGFYTSGRLLSDVHTLLFHRDKMTAISIAEPVMAIGTLITTLYCQQFFSNDAFKLDGEALVVAAVLALEMGRTLGARLGGMCNHWLAVDTMYRKDSTVKEIACDCFHALNAVKSTGKSIFASASCCFHKIRKCFAYQGTSESERPFLPIGSIN